MYRTYIRIKSVLRDTDDAALPYLAGDSGNGARSVVVFEVCDHSESPKHHVVGTFGIMVDLPPDFGQQVIDKAKVRCKEMFSTFISEGWLD